jgi:hypothetical protein
MKSVVFQVRTLKSMSSCLYSIISLVCLVSFVLICLYFYLYSNSHISTFFQKVKKVKISVIVSTSYHIPHEVTIRNISYSVFDYV